MTAKRVNKNQAERDDWIAHQLNQLPDGWKLLDAGAGEQPYRKHCKHLWYVSQDFGEYSPEGAEAGLQMPAWDYGQLDHVCDIASIPEEDASFDAVLCSEVFEHLPNPLAALQEFARLVRPGGCLLITAPFVSLTHFAPHHYATGFNRFFYETHLPACGFDIEQISHNGNYFDLVSQEVARIKSVAKRYHAGRTRWHERMAIKTVQAMLRRLSSHGHLSTDLGCFGLHVRATRRPRAVAAA